jgi:nitroreductase
MDAYKCLIERRSVKKYQSKNVSDEIIEKICVAGTFAASGKNRQPSIILAITNKELRDKLSKLNAKILGRDIDPFYNAPCVLVVLADK